MQRFLPEGCCQQIIVYETNKTSDFFYGFSIFLGVWYQVCQNDENTCVYFNALLQTGIQVNGKQLYKKIGNGKVHLSFTNVTESYPTPWTMWGGKSPGSHVGNIKIGPRQLKCPEDSSVHT